MTVQLNFRKDLFVGDLRMQLEQLLQKFTKEQRSKILLIEEGIDLHFEKIVELRRERRQGRQFGFLFRGPGNGNDRHGTFVAGRFGRRI